VILCPRSGAVCIKFADQIGPGRRAATCL
jgi:hypothetical protein